MSTKTEAFLQDIQAKSADQYEQMQAIRTLFQAADPELVEDIKYGGYGFFRGKLLIGGIFPYKAHMSIEFSNGAQFDDPEQILEGKGKLRRHLKIRTMADIEEKAAKGFIAQAVKTLSV